MSKIKLSKSFIRSSCKVALNEDLFPSGDITTSLLDNNSIKKVKLISKYFQKSGFLRLFFKKISFFLK